MDRFKFDTTTTANFVEHGGGIVTPACLNNGTGCSHDSTLTYRGSQGNLLHHNHNQLPHTSCTSIAQNLSTSDQQPLIIDIQHDRCQHHYQQHNIQPQPQNHALTNHCCLRTTSFMANPSSSNCTCCEHQTLRRSSASGGGREVGNRSFGTSMNGNPSLKLRGTDEDLRKSRTLTRVYKPLNDLHFPNTSTNNLLDNNNFYIPPNEIRAKNNL